MGIEDGVEAAPEGLSEIDLVRKFQKELNAGLVAFVLLSILDRAGEDLYGYQIAKQLQSAGADTPIAVKQGALYPVLRALAARGLLASRIVPSYSGPARRYYRITAPGREVLSRWQIIWSETRQFVDHLTAPPKPTDSTGAP